jgi:FkbM family methyltransferase
VYYIKRYFFQQLAKSKNLTFILHKIWIGYQYIRSNYLYFLFFKLKVKINSLSDRGQDKWIINIFELKKKLYKGFFLEIGGGNGFSNSNTFILEEYFGWKGILVEPDPEQFKKLKILRTRAITSNKLIYDTNTNLNFLRDGELSKVVTAPTTEHKNNIITIESIPLIELLNYHNSPRIIDFFSLDVEGSEEKVLTEDVLNQYIFLSLCIERPNLKLHELLTKKNYVFIKSNLYDYFYIHRDFFNYEKVYKNKKKITEIYESK